MAPEAFFIEVSLQFSQLTFSLESKYEDGGGNTFTWPGKSSEEMTLDSLMSSDSQCLDL